MEIERFELKKTCLEMLDLPGPNFHKGPQSLRQSQQVAWRVSMLGGESPPTLTVVSKSGFRIEVRKTIEGMSGFDRAAGTLRLAAWDFDRWRLNRAELVTAIAEAWMEVDAAIVAGKIRQGQNRPNIRLLTILKRANETPEGSLASRLYGVGVRVLGDLDGMTEADLINLGFESDLPLLRERLAGRGIVLPAGPARGMARLRLVDGGDSQRDD